MFLRLRNFYFSVWMVALVAILSFAFKSENYLYASDRIQVSQIYPNPATDSISVTLSDGFDSGKIIFYTILGQKVLEKTISTQSPTISLKNLNSGIYFYKIESNNFSKNGKIIKQ